MDKQLIEIAEPKALTSDYVSKLAAALAVEWAKQLTAPLTPKEAQVILGTALAAGARPEVQPDGANDSATLLDTVVFANPDVVAGLVQSGSDGDLLPFSGALLNHFDIKNEDGVIFADPLFFAYRIFKTLDDATKVTGTVNLLKDPSQKAPATTTTTTGGSGPEQKGDVVPEKKTDGTGPMPDAGKGTGGSTASDGKSKTSSPATKEDGMSFGTKLVIGVAVVGIGTATALLIKDHMAKKE